MVVGHPEGELLQMWRGRCSVQPVHPAGNEPPNAAAAAAGDGASAPRGGSFTCPPSDHTRDQLGNGRITPLFTAFTPFHPLAKHPAAQTAGVRSMPAGPMGWEPGTREEEESKRGRCWNIIKGQYDFIILT